MKIINGAEVLNSEFDFMAALLNGGRFFCGGVLLDNTTVLTGGCWFKLMFGAFRGPPYSHRRRHQHHSAARAREPPHLPTHHPTCPTPPACPACSLSLRGGHRHSEQP